MICKKIIVKVIEYCQIFQFTSIIKQFLKKFQRNLRPPDTRRAVQNSTLSSISLESGVKFVDQFTHSRPAAPRRTLYVIGEITSNNRWNMHKISDVYNEPEWIDIRWLVLYLKFS